ncbi:PREDICTED: uncharacterized protein LOC109592202, partial [Amphimedon queenslandica]|uniref:Death domain-containing protein n=2 Tax=Amphimedon queenslandica TaxID=400682 RepID=A0AAN0K1Q5_AMPQE
MAEGGKTAKEVFIKTLPKLINTLGKDPPFTVVTASLYGMGLITKQELEAIKTKQGVERGSKVGFTLRDKIHDSDDPNACLLAICEIFESDDVNNDILRKHGASMRTSISSGTGTAATLQVPSYPPPTVVSRTSPNMYNIYINLFRTNGNANDYLKLTLQKWLERRDNVTRTTWDNLIRAVKSTGDMAAAERILGILKS